jgi:predicted acetyltransferase
MISKIHLRTIALEEKEQFLEMAARYFKELNPQFCPHTYWKENYFSKLYSNPDLFLKWIVKKQTSIGFVLYGVVNHLYLERKIGNIHDFYIVSAERRQGNAKLAAHLLIKELKKYHPTNIELEIVQGNDDAMQFWQSIGFCPSNHKYVLGE